MDLIRSQTAHPPNRELRRAGGLFLFLLLNGCGVDSAQKHYAFAERHWGDGNYAAAVTEFEKVIRRDGQGVLGLQALFRAAMTQTLFLGRDAEAYENFRRYTTISTDRSSVWAAKKQMGEILFSKLYRYSDAIQHYQQLLQERPKGEEGAEFAYRIAKAHFYLWQFEEAVAGFKHVTDRFPGSSWAEKAMFEIGSTLFTGGEQRLSKGGAPPTEIYNRAIQAYENFLKHYPESVLAVHARFGIASCLEEMDQLDQAAKRYEDLAAAYPSPRVVQVKLGRIQQRITEKGGKYTGHSP